MANERRDIVGGAVVTTLTSTLLTAATSTSIAASTGWPAGTNGPFFAVVDEGLSGEEKILVTTRTGLNLTSIARGQDGTTASDHQSGATIRCCLSARELDEANKLVSQTLGAAIAKGDLFAASGAANLGRLAVGANDTILIADSAQGTGMKWGALVVPSGGISAATQLVNDVVTYPKIQNVTATDRLLGRDTASAGDIEELTVGGGLEFTGTLGIQRSALTGDVTAAAGSNTLAIGNLKVLTAMLNDLAVTTAKLADANVTQAKMASEAATSWTPTLSGWAIGNGTVSGQYLKYGRLVHAEALITMGSTSTFSGNPTIGGLPFAAGATIPKLGLATFTDASAGVVNPGWLLLAAGASSMSPRYGYDAGVGPEGAALLDNNQPFNWTTNDTMTLSIDYIAAS